MVTVVDLAGSTTSSSHIHYLVIVRSSQDHIPVIHFYVEEHVLWYKWILQRGKIDLEAYICNRVERSSI